MMGWCIDKEISGPLSDYLTLMLGKPLIRRNTLKTSLRFPSLGLSPVTDKRAFIVPKSIGLNNILIAVNSIHTLQYNDISERI